MAESQGASSPAAWSGIQAQMAHSAANFLAGSLLVFADCFEIFHHHVDKWRRIQGWALQIKFKDLREQGSQSETLKKTKTGT